MRTLVLGLGNPILRDDGVGIRVAERLRPLLADRPDVTVDEDFWGGLRLMERMIGYDRAIVIDAVAPGGEPGRIRFLRPDSIPTQRSSSAHDVNLPTALELGRVAGAHLPPTEEIFLVGIEAADVLTFGETFTPEVEAAVPRATEAVLTILDEKRERT
ncbi:MAG: hydrogenase maturation protease [Candidatus Eisenbacteria bacterium]